MGRNKVLGHLLWNSVVGMDITDENPSNKRTLEKQKKWVKEGRIVLDEASSAHLPDSAEYIQHCWTITEHRTCTHYISTNYAQAGSRYHNVLNR